MKKIPETSFNRIINYERHIKSEKAALSMPFYS